MKLEYYTPKVNVKWVTPNGDQMLGDLARVSVKDGDGKPVEKLLKYMAEKSHWSPFDMVNFCVEVHAPRDISRQILRHWSIHPQERSLRYSSLCEDDFVLREARMQHPTNRQMSIDVDPDEVNDVNAANWWKVVQQKHIERTLQDYEAALEFGIAKEQARVILPEGNTMSKLYLNGTVRSWITYLKVRQDIDTTQREHVWVANEIAKLFAVHFPITHKAFFPPVVNYEVICSTTGVTVATVSDQHEMKARVLEWYPGVKPEQVVVSFQPNLEFCRITVDHGKLAGVRWVDYKLSPTEPAQELK